MIHNIIHISDTHIRAGDSTKSRYDEYIKTFDNLFASVAEQQSIKENTAVIVITGDIFHNKNKIEPAGLKIATYMLHGLASLAPVYVIRGNHDYRQDLPKEHDMLSALMSYSIPNVTYLDTTGIYTHKNISFGLVAIQDTLLFGSTSGITSSLPDFPIPTDTENYKVALFHGSVTGAKLQNGMDIGDTLHGYPIDWFKGFDAILLGDIHLQQINNATLTENDKHILPHTTPCHTYKFKDEGTPWGYPGSLIQQDFGEPIKGHGYVLWNMKDKIIHTYHIKNTYGMIKLRYNGNIDELEIQHKQYIKFPTNFVPLDKIINYKWFPDMVHIRVYGESVTAEILRSITERLQSYGKTVLTINKKVDDTVIVSKSAESDIDGGDDLDERQFDIHSINSVETLIEYIDGILDTENKTLPDTWKLWLKTPETITIPLDNIPEKITKRVTDKSDKLNKFITKYVEDFEKIKTQQVVTSELHINKLEWSWILNYGDNNVFDFDKNINQINIINAKNGCGKSNFFEIICIALFGEGFPSRYNKNYTADIICDKKPHGVTSHTSITFTLNDVKYTISRNMRTASSKRIINFDGVVLYKYSDDGSNKPSILHQKSKAVADWVDINIGKCDMYLLTAMLSQNADNDFFKLGVKDQKELLDRVLSLEHIDSLKVLLKETVKYYNSVIEIIETYYDGISQSYKVVDQKTLDELAFAKADMTRLHTEIGTLHQKWNIIPERDLLNANITTVEYNIKLLQNKISESTKSKECDIKSEIIALDRLIVSIENKLSSLHSFSDLVVGDLTAPDIVRTGVEERLLELKHILESHPFYNSVRYNVYEDILSISTKFCSDDAKMIGKTSREEMTELFDIIRNFETWNKIQIKKFESDKKYFQTESEISLMQTKINSLNSIIYEYPTQIEKIKKQGKAYKKLLQKATLEKELCSERRPNRPMKDENWMAGVKDEIEEYGTLAELEECRLDIINKLKIIPVVNANIIRLKGLIEDGEIYLKECDTLPFNPKCGSCKKQPWRTKYDEIVLELPRLKMELDNDSRRMKDELGIGGDMTVEEYVSELETNLEECGLLIDNARIYINELTVRETYSKWLKEYETKKAEFDTLKEQYDSIEVQLRRVEDELQRAKSEKNELQNILDNINLKLAEYEQYEAEREVRRVEADACRQKLEGMWYATLYLYRTQIDTLIKLLKRDLSYNKDMRCAAVKVLDEIRQRDKLIVELDSLIRLKDVYPLWKKWSECVGREKELAIHIRDLELQVAGAKSGTDNVQKLAMVEMIGCLQQNISTIEYISGAFNGFREWIYKEQIAPLIQSRVNSILELICDGRPLYLETEWLDAIDTLSWFVRDGTSRPVIEKASGFQRFIIGIAMRVAINQIGFCPIKYDELFIDEGFTACDSEHLERVPDFLRGLLRFYKNIYLATHLEDLKGCADKHIYIERSVDGLSRIQYGSIETIKSVEDTTKEKTKKRGRPPKGGAGTSTITVMKV